MRLALALVVLCGCIDLYDPIAEIEYREFPDTATAISSILAEAGKVSVYAVGEYHPSRAGAAKRSPLARFTTDIIDLLEPHARHLVIETWLDDGCFGSSAAVRTGITDATGRPAGTTTDLEALVMRSQRLNMQSHGLPITCIEHGSLLDAMGRVDFLRLLELVTEKLGATARALIADDRAVIVYGGALHNDLYPRWPLEDLSYAHALAKELPGAIVELDLVVPEVVAPMAMVRREHWFPLLGRAAPERVLVWQRGPGSYVLILPAQSLEAAKVALPIASL